MCCGELGDDVLWTTESPWQNNPGEVHSNVRWSPGMQKTLVWLRLARVTIQALRTTHCYSILQHNYGIHKTARFMLGSPNTWKVQYIARSNLWDIHVWYRNTWHVKYNAQSYPWEAKHDGTTTFIFVSRTRKNIVSVWNPNLDLPFIRFFPFCSWFPVGLYCLISNANEVFLYTFYCSFALG